VTHDDDQPWLGHDGGRRLSSTVTWVLDGVYQWLKMLNKAASKSVGGVYWYDADEMSETAEQCEGW
jgi:hypothetical protein